MSQATRAASKIDYAGICRVIARAVVVLGVLSFAMVADVARFQVTCDTHKGDFGSQFSLDFDTPGRDCHIEGFPSLPTVRFYDNGFGPRIVGQ
jgi:hypothetical protein